MVVLFALISERVWSVVPSVPVMVVVFSPNVFLAVIVVCGS